MDNNNMMQQGQQQMEEERRHVELRTLDEQNEWKTQKLDMDEMPQEMNWNNYMSVKMTTVERMENGIMKLIPQEIVPMRQAIVEEGWQTLHGDEQMSNKERKERLKRLDKQAKNGIRAKKLYHERNDEALAKKGEIAAAYKATLSEEEQRNFQPKRWLASFYDLSGTEEAQQKNFALIENVENKDKAKRHEGYKVILDQFKNVDRKCFQPPINDDKKLMEYYEKYGKLLMQGGEMEKILDAVLGDGYEMSEEEEVNFRTVGSMLETMFWMVEQRIKMIGNVYHAILSDDEREELDKALREGNYFDFPKGHKWEKTRLANPEFKAYVLARGGYLSRLDSKDIGYQMDAKLEKRLESEHKVAVKKVRDRRMDTLYPGFLKTEQNLKESHPDITEEAALYIWRGRQAKAESSGVTPALLKRVNKKFKGRPNSLIAVKKGFKYCARDVYGRYATERDRQMAEWNNLYAEAMLSDRVEDRLPFLVNIIDEMDAIQLPRLENVFSKGMFRGDMNEISRMRDSVEAFYYMQKSRTNTKTLRENMPEQFERIQQLNAKFEAMNLFLQWFDCITRTMMNVTGGESARYDAPGKDSLLLQRQMDLEKMYRDQKQRYLDNKFGMPGFGALREEADKDHPGLSDLTVLYCAEIKASGKRLLKKEDIERLQEKYQGTGIDLQRSVYGLMKMYRTGPDGSPLTGQDHANKAWNDGYVQAMLSDNYRDRDTYLNDMCDEVIQCEVPTMAQMKDDAWMVAHYESVRRLMSVHLMMDNLKADRNNAEFFGNMPAERAEALKSKRELLLPILGWLMMHLQAGGIDQYGNFLTQERLASMKRMADIMEAGALATELKYRNMAGSLDRQKVENILVFNREVNGKLLTAEEFAERLAQREAKSEECSQAKKLVDAEKQRAGRVNEAMKPYAERDKQMEATGRIMRALLQGDGHEEEQEFVQNLYSEDQAKRHECYEFLLDKLEEMRPEYLKRGSDKEILKTYEDFREELAIGFVLKDFLTEIRQKDGFVIAPERLDRLNAMGELLTVYHGYLSGRVKELGSDYFGMFAEEDVERLMGMTVQVGTESAEDRAEIRDYAMQKVKAREVAADELKAGGPQQEYEEILAKEKQRRQMAEEEERLDRTYGVKGFAKLRREADKANRQDISNRAIQYAACLQAEKNKPLDRERRKRIEKKYRDAGRMEELNRNVMGFLRNCRLGANGQPLTEQDRADYEWNNRFVDAMLSENVTDREPYLQDIINEFMQAQIPTVASLKDDEWLMKHMPEALRLLGIGLRIDNLIKKDEENGGFFSRMPREQFAEMDRRRDLITTIATWLELYLQSGGVTQQGKFADQEHMKQSAAAAAGLEQFALETERKFRGEE